MNIVEVIMQQFSGQTGRLSSMLGESESTTNSAVGAAVPALLSAFMGLTKTNEGAQKVASAINTFDPASANLNQPGSLLTQGSSLVSSLFGGSGISSAITALSGFTGAGSGTMKTLLGYLAPMVIGAISSHFKGAPATAEGVSHFFSEQKSNIAAAMPAGLSIPGLQGIASGAEAAEAHAEKEMAFAGAHSSGDSKPHSRWLTPVIVLLLLAGLAYFMSQRKESNVSVKTTPPAVAPDIKKEMPVEVSYAPPGEMLSKMYTGLKETLATVKDKSSAQAALPALDKVATRAEDMKTSMDTYPAGVRSALKTITTDNLSGLKEQIGKLDSIPGVSEVLGPVLKRIVSALTSLG